MRTLSARILLGFAALTVTFGVITATVVVNMMRVEEQILAVRAGYVPLAMASKDLETRQEDLKKYLEDSFLDEPGGPSSARPNLNRDKASREAALRQIQKVLDEVPTGSFKDTRAVVERIASSVQTLAPTYAKLRTLLVQAQAAETPTLDTAEIRDVHQQLRIAERAISDDAHDLAFRLDRSLKATTERVEGNERTLRRWTIYFGIAAVLLGLAITTWVVINLRPLGRLRDAARRVASGSYDSRIDERGPAEVADLAHELNSMARAVEERERELVRSERLAAVGKMAAMITHEVRNPLASIGLNTELLEDELDPSQEEARKLCTSIHREVDRLTAITEEYLTFSRLPKPKITAEAVNTLVGSLAQFVREDLAAKQVKLEVELGPGDPIAMIDGAQLRQCLINLVRNASDAVVAKGGGKVTLRTRRNGDRIVVEVEDDGVGIPPDVLPRLFDPFFSTKEGGNGLGLALTQQIVRDHGGDLAVESTHGRGTTFTVSVPAGNMGR